MGPIQTLSEGISMVRRRAIVIMAVAALGVVGGVFVALKSERVYQATAVVQVVAPTITEDLAASTVGGSSARRVQLIEQQLMSRENLLDLGRRFGLFDGRPLSPNEQLILMRSSILIQNIAAAQQGFSMDGSLSALLISTSLSDPEIAAAISNELAQSLVDASASRRTQLAQDTLSFFLQEEERLRSEIATLDDRIAEFKSRFESALPAAVETRREEMSRLEESRLAVEREIVALRNELAGLDRNSTLAVVVRRRAQLEEQIESRDQQLGLVTQRVQELSMLFQRAPEIERELNGLERQLTQLQNQLNTTVQRRRDAEVGQRIEEDQQSERFVLLEPALVPEYPISRSRRTVVMAAAVAGLMGGLILAFVLEWLNPVLRTSGRMEREMDLRPVISIPYTRTRTQIRRSRRRRISFGILGSLLAAVGGLAFLKR